LYLIIFLYYLKLLENLKIFFGHVIRETYRSRTKDFRNFKRGVYSPFNKDHRNTHCF
jgi:hypothetical protein